MKAVHSLSVIWVAILLIISMSGCQTGERKITRGEGNVVGHKEKLEFFHSIELNGMFDVELHRSDTLFASVETDSNLVDLISIYVSDSVLILSTYGETLLKPTRLKIRIGYNQLRSIQIEGACDLKAKDIIETDSLKLLVSGAAEIDMELAVDYLATHVAGAGNLTLVGEANRHVIRLSGATRLKAEHLTTESTQLDMAGAGKAEVYTSRQLDVNLSGVGSVRYHGNPVVRNLNISGLGEIVEVETRRRTAE